MRLYFFYMDGCPACEAAKPELAKFERAHRGIQIVRADLLKTKWTYRPWQPEATPTYVLEAPGYPRVQYVGTLTKQKLEEFIRTAKNLVGMP